MVTRVRAVVRKHFWERELHNFRVYELKRARDIMRDWLNNEQLSLCKIVLWNIYAFTTTNKLKSTQCQKVQGGLESYSQFFVRGRLRRQTQTLFSNVTLHLCRH